MIVSNSITGPKKIKVGTANPVKVAAAQAVLSRYFCATVEGVDVCSGVSDQPQNMDETVTGALNRALRAYRDGADLGVGIESGLMEGPLGWMNFTAAVLCEKDTGIFLDEIAPAGLFRLRDPNGMSLAVENGFHFGHSSAFPLPNSIAVRMLEGDEMDKAVHDVGLVDVPNIGKVRGGFLGVLTKGRISRKQYSSTALQMALISYENKKMFLKGV